MTTMSEEKIVKFEPRASRDLVEVSFHIGGSEIVEILPRNERNRQARVRYYNGDITVDEYLNIVQGGPPCSRCGHVHQD